MSNYIVSARKYRPDTFRTVVGQDAITTTLKNSIIHQHLAHAYLFCGPRGVGKTTCARIFAKTINCFNISSETEACNECDSCKGFNRSSSFNIHELDAASNNSVDDIRNLVDQVRIPPQIGKYSIYIIDEVHMLSAGAFNAFLKTLEEPPAHAIFILATTEKHKIIPTILSRCQVFDFKRIHTEDIVSHLTWVSKQEEVNSDPDALNIIAQKADGAMRDALSIFDQLVSFSGKDITYAGTIENLNVLDYDYYFRVVEAFIRGNIPEALVIFNNILDAGFDPQYFISGLSSHLRDLLVCKDAQTISLLEVGAGIREKYKIQAISTPVPFLLQALEITNQCDIDYKSAKNKNLHIEVALLKICKFSGKVYEVKESTQPLPEKSNAPVSETAAKPSTVNTPTPPTNPTPVSRPSESAKTFSIKAAEPEKKNNDVSTPVAKSESLQQESFTQEQLIEVWNRFAQSKSSDPRKLQILTSRKPILGNNFKIAVPVIHEIQEEEIRGLHDELLLFLRNELRNNSISITVEMTEDNEPEKKRLYSDREKLQFMEENFPEAKKLRESLQLDFDH